MAKIRSFADYDSAKEARDENFEAEVESKLEFLLSQENKKIEQGLAKTTKKIRENANRFGLVGALIKNITYVVEDFSLDQMNKLQIKAKQEITISDFRSNVADLVSCGFSYVSRGEYGEQNQEQLYVRFLDEFQELIDQGDPFFEEKYSATRPLLRRMYVPSGEGFDDLIGIIRGLKKNNYISSKKVKPLIELFSPIPEVIRENSEKKPISVQQPFEERKVLIENKKPISVDCPAKDNSREVQQYLELIFGLPEPVAQEYNSQVTLDELRVVYRDLKQTVGEKYVLLLVQENPDILTYSQQSTFTKYLTTLELVQTRIRKNGFQDGLAEGLGIEENIPLYADLISLLDIKRELFNEEKVVEENFVQPNQLDISRIQISEYQTFHRSNSNAERWLSTLIDNGALTIGRHEHWSSRSKDKGARGRAIVDKMAYDIKTIFQDLGLERPNIAAKYAQRTLEISDESREVLRDIRDQVYARQRE